MAMSADQDNRSPGLDLGPVPLLDWLPGETLFSICSRQHRFWGHTHSWTTAAILFGGRQSGTQHDLPNHLDDFVARTGQALGTASAVALSRTLLSFYRPFLSVQTVENAVAAMRSGSVAHLKFNLGLLTSRFRANHPLKSCPACRLQDRADFGWSYWHIDQQFPGVWTCPRHAVALQESTMKATGVGRFLWTLPTDDLPFEPVHQPDGARLVRWCSLSDFIVKLVEADSPPGWLHGDQLQAALLAEVRSRGWMSAMGSLRVKPMAGEFLAYCRELSSIRELTALPKTTEEAVQHLGRLLRPLRTGTHPLRLLTVAHWLFESAEELCRALDHQAGALPPVAGYSAPLSGVVDGRSAIHSEVIERILKGDAVSTVARQIGIDIATAKGWAARDGISTPRRASILRPAVIEKLKSDLGSGADKDQAARQHGISISTVNRILRTEVGLHTQWQVARERQAREEARSSWEGLLAIHGRQGTKFLRAADPRTYAWLYRNDHAWLLTHSPVRLSASLPGSPSVLWDERDRTLKAAVDVAVLELRRLSSDKPLRLWQVYQRVPDLKAKLAHLDRLPLTARALELAVARRKRRADRT